MGGASLLPPCVMEDYSYLEPEQRSQPGRCTVCHLETTDLRFHRCPVTPVKRVDEMTLEEYENWLASNPTSGFLCSCGEVFDSRRELEEHYWGHIPTPDNG